LEWGPDGVTDPRLAALNPLSQVPTLVMHSGEIMTESGAIVLLLADRYPESGLAPPVWHEQRAAFLRWLMFINASIYPTFTYGDFAHTWAGPAGGDQLKETTLARRTENYRVLNACAVEPFFLGNSMSAIDLYIAAFVTWTPGWAWFEANTPKLVAIADRVKQNIFLRSALMRNKMSD
jgi:GST-like protein